VLVDPVGTGERAAEAGGDTVASGPDLGEVDVDFSNNTGHVDALKVANTSPVDIIWEHKRELLESDLILADGALISVAAAWKDVVVIVHVMDIHIGVALVPIVIATGNKRTSESGGSKEEG